MTFNFVAGHQITAVEDGSRGQLDKMLVPYPANQIIRVVLVLCKPKLAFLTNDVENLCKRSV